MSRKLLDATGLGLVDVGSWRLHACSMVFDRPGVVRLGDIGPSPLVRNEVVEYMQRTYGPGGPMEPMRIAYRDWPPAREGWRR